jgi:hypothetical protein
MGDEFIRPTATGRGAVAELYSLFEIAYGDRLTALCLADRTEPTGGQTSYCAGERGFYDDSLTWAVYSLADDLVPRREG